MLAGKCYCLAQKRDQGKYRGNKGMGCMGHLQAGVRPRCSDGLPGRCRKIYGGTVCQERDRVATQTIGKPQATRQDFLLLLQLRVLCPGFLQDGEVGVFAEG
jgi:hypothetical protein